MDKYFMRVLLTDAEGVETECWEYVENDVVLGYLNDEHTIVAEPHPSLTIRYIAHGDDAARTMYPAAE